MLLQADEMHKIKVLVELCKGVVITQGSAHATLRSIRTTLILMTSISLKIVVVVILSDNGCHFDSCSACNNGYFLVGLR